MVTLKDDKLKVAKQKAAHPGPNVHIFPNTLDTSRLMEVSGCNAFPATNSASLRNMCFEAEHIPHDIPVRANGQKIHLLLLHDVFELPSNFPCFAHEFWMKEVLHAPVIAVATQMSAG